MLLLYTHFLFVVVPLWLILMGFVLNYHIMRMQYGCSLYDRSLLCEVLPVCILTALIFLTVFLGNRKFYSACCIILVFVLWIWFEHFFRINGDPSYFVLVVVGVYTVSVAMIGVI